MKGHLEQRLHPKVQEPVQRIRSGMQGVIQRKVPIAAVLRNADAVAVGICPAVFRRLRTVECRFQEKMERLTSELSDLFAQSHTLEDEIRKQMAKIGFTIK